MLSMSSKGQIKGSASAHLYLANAKLLEASKAATPTAARQLRLQAQQHLALLATLRPATDQESLGRLQSAMEMILSSTRGYDKTYALA